jgi:hypothetical protein
MVLSLYHRWSRLLCMALCALPLQALAAAPGCEPEPPARTGVSEGRPLLGQGIALYESRDMAQAERTLQAALDAGLADPAERASAHKYLAFAHCTQKQWSRCEADFASAFAAHAGFALQAYETTGTPWGQAYSRALERRAQACPTAQRAAGTPPAATGAIPAGFALNSRVIAAVTPLTSEPAAPRPQAAPAPGSDHNLRLRVGPWAHVRIDGKPMGVTPPLVLLKLAAGTHTVELISPGFESFRQVVQLTDGQLLTLSHDFDAR